MEMKMFKKVSRILGGLAIIALLASQAFGAAVTINITGITNHSGVALNGAYVQVIQSTDANAGSPAADGSPSGDTVVSTGTVNSGTFSSGASITSNNYVYIRVWETWNGTGSPSTGTYYGSGPAENVGSGFVYAYDPAGFSTNVQFGINPLNITTTSLPNGKVGTAYNQTLTATGGTIPYTWTVSAGSLPAGLTLSSAGVISGTPTTAQTADFTVQVADSAAGTDTQALSITINPAGGNGPNISGIAPTSAYPGQTIVISGTKFGATKGASTITIGGVPAIPTSWSDTSITVAVPYGAANGNVVVTVSGETGTSSITLKTGGAIIDDYEGGCVADWVAADSGYYVFDQVLDITPNKDNISAQLRQTLVKHHGTYGAKVKYSYVGTDGTDWGGGWGGKLVYTIDLSSYNKISFAVKWDGSTNGLKLSLQDSDGTASSASVSNATLASFNATYGVIDIQKTSFAYDQGGSKSGADAIFDWTKVVSYNMIYDTPGISNNDHYIDCVTAGDVQFPDDPPSPTGEVTITSVTPPTGPAGTKVAINGTGFGTIQGQSRLAFESNAQDNVTYPMTVLSWSDTLIEAIVPRLAPKGSYTLKVIKMSISQGTLRALESNPKGFQVTSSSPSGGSAIIFPNPFNPLAIGLTSSGLAANAVNIAYDASGIANIGIYVYDSTGRQVYHNITSLGQITWNGRDADGNIVADGLYLLRVVNEDTKSLIAKGRILVIKK
jgi:hypothetical protein